MQIFDKVQSEDNTPNCCYCDNRLDGPTINGMHKRCHILYNQEMDVIDSDRRRNIADILLTAFDNKR